MPKLRHTLDWNSSISSVNGRQTNEEDEAAERDEDSRQERVQENKSLLILQDILSDLVIQQLCLTENPGNDAKRSRTKSSIRAHDGAKVAADIAPTKRGLEVEELQEFIEYLACEICEALPEALRLERAEEASAEDDVESTAPEQLLAVTPVTVVDSLGAYGILGTDEAKGTVSAEDFLRKLYKSYLTAVEDERNDRIKDVSTPTKPSECELCSRDWINLTVHHLIPRETWPKAIKRGWIANEEEGHRRIAWICRACHNLVHRIASNEELARHYGSVELLEAREDVQTFVAWVGRVRWKKR